MSLRPEEVQAVRDIYSVIYGEGHRRDTAHPTWQTVELLEKALLEIQKCNRRIRTLFASLPCSAAGRGFLKRCLRATATMMRRSRSEFAGCRNRVSASLRSEIVISAQGI
ncbi:hypothetical protein CAI21_08455 [Alkalilimnicola ehrlichii]|uniref:Uncharacterized protein n=1 Tax=Alkalilimnicola ehrlichii TaxID=351052 RepID=A0A3E0WTY8_9GAMM|nr:hypothetical protein CAI21_08455 [Alkalilimnicola ehrlichii]RFA36444.1 hypothetical protein CAL65_10720 [Alkalilimnicola ehrlichii]